MRLARALAGGGLLATVILLSSDSVWSQAKDKEAPKAKGQIPPGWGRLNLTAAQKQSIYAIQAEYREKIKALEDERQKKLVGVLSADQKKTLAEGLAGDGADAKPKDKGGKDKAKD